MAPPPISRLLAVVVSHDSAKSPEHFGWVYTLPPDGCSMAKMSTHPKWCEPQLGIQRTITIVAKQYFSVPLSPVKLGDLYLFSNSSPVAQSPKGCSTVHGKGHEVSSTISSSKAQTMAYPQRWPVGSSGDTVILSRFSPAPDARRRVEIDL